jgi:hypothetical protein
MKIRTFLAAVFCSHLLSFVAGNHSFSDARKRFQDILVVVKYNYKAPPGSVLLHLRMWNKVFLNQIIFVPWTVQEIGNFTERNHVGNGNVTIVSKIDPVEIDTGYLAYEVVTSAMKSHPDVAGYLFVHDDLAMNVSALMDLDHEKVWQSDFIQREICRDLDEGWKNKTNYWWWDGEWGTDAIDQMLLNHTDIAAEMKESLGSNHIWCGEQSDFFYIPQKYKDSYIRVMSAFAESNIFLEIAVPTFIRAYIPRSKCSKVLTCTFFTDEGRNDFAYMERECGDRYPLYHPVKLSSKLNVVGMKKKMALIDDSTNLRKSFQKRPAQP